MKDITKNPVFLRKLSKLERSDGATLPDIREIFGHLGDCPWHLQVYSEVGSTNTLLKQMAAQEGVTEKLKAADPLKWTRLMNNLRHSVQEIVQAEVIYA